MFEPIPGFYSGGWACENCEGSLYCFNEHSPSFPYFCGMYPGTGPYKKDPRQKKKNDDRKEAID